MAQFGDLLAELRQDRGLTQSELGKVSLHLYTIRRSYEAIATCVHYFLQV